MYKNNLNNAKAPTRKNVFKPGWHTWEVTDIKLTQSKKGNDMFVATLTEDEELKSIDIFMITDEEKGWFLKQFLKACGAPQDKDGTYIWEEKDVIGKKILGFVENEPNIWIDRQGAEHKDEQSKVVELKDMPL